ncbi:MAG: hypothetical protein ACXW1F_03355, partial [Halobacteriota archaeon]
TIAHKRKTSRDHQREEERDAQKSGFANGTSHESHPFANATNLKACYQRQKHGSVIKRCGFVSANEHLYEITTRFRYASLLASPLDSLNR